VNPIALPNLVLDLEASEILRTFDTFDPAEWSIVRNLDRWELAGDRIRGGAPDAPFHGQIFNRTPVVGDVALDFETRIVPPSYHDIVWLWNVRFDAEPWSGGYLGCLGGWWSNMAGIEKLPDYVPSSIAPSHATEPGRWYHVVSGSVGGTHFIVVDGVVTTFFTDPAVPDPAQPGYYGFGFYESQVEFRNLRVLHPAATPRTPPTYAPA